MTTEPNNQIIIYEDTNGEVKLDVSLENETVWLSQKQLEVLFDKSKKTISEHIGNIFKEGELEKDAVVRNFRTTASDGKNYNVTYYNLDVIISVGYRVKSKRGTAFRIWATKVLKEYLINGYAINQKRLEQKGLKELNETISLLKDTISKSELELSEAKGLLDVILNYSRTWSLLQGYDEDSLKCDFVPKEANLLYYIIKGHPFNDGNKRIGAFMFILFLSKNNRLYKANGELKINDNALVALALMTAKSDPKQKDTVINLIVNILEG